MLYTGRSGPLQLPLEPAIQPRSAVTESPGPKRQSQVQEADLQPKQQQLLQVKEGK